jgi:hypothetical protein
MTSIEAVQPRDAGLASELLPGGRSTALRRTLAAVSRAPVTEWPLITIVAVMATFWTLEVTAAVAADTWLNLLGGRIILHHGLPHRDTLAVISHGYRWIDEQWLSNLIFYGVYRVGGLIAVAELTILLFVGATALAFAIARLRGASAASVAGCGWPLILIGATFARAEVFVQPLAILLIALLASESRRRTSRVWLAFPILILWANLHGSVVLGAALTSALGLIELINVGRSRRFEARSVVRGIVLALAAWPCLFASPYGLELKVYYRETLHNPAFGHFLTEWQTPSLLSVHGLATVYFIGLACFLLGRRRGALTAFELTTIAVTGLAAVDAARSVVWFAYACVLLLPATVPAPRAERTENDWSIRLAMAIAAAGTLMFIGYTLAAPPGGLAKEPNQRGLNRIAQVLRSDPQARVFASYDLGDWLLFRLPQLKGRLAYDGRWEILPPAQMDTLVAYLRQTGPGWERPSFGYRLVVLNAAKQGALVKTYKHRLGVRTLYLHGGIAVFDRGPAADG